MEIHVPVIRKI